MVNGKMVNGKMVNKKNIATLYNIHLSINP